MCHSAVPEIEKGAIKYYSSSPDEEALLYGAEKFDYKYEVIKVAFSRDHQTKTKYFEKSLGFQKSNKKVETLNY